ncbi:hypothetical protein ROTAS13_04382 [Roseomonas sp. TAS13]|nr:hypothetical protein ROTAS13_04382 [Roseomonas sp. TAS13]
MLGGEVGAEGDQQADQRLDARVLPGAAQQALLHEADHHGHGHADGDAAEGELEEGDGGLGEGEGAGERGRDGEAQADQAGGVVQEGLAFQDVHQPVRDGHARGDR